MKPTSSLPPAGEQADRVLGTATPAPPQRPRQRKRLLGRQPQPPRTASASPCSDAAHRPSPTTPPPRAPPRRELDGAMHRRTEDPADPGLIGFRTRSRGVLVCVSSSASSQEAPLAARSPPSRTQAGNTYFQRSQESAAAPSIRAWRASVGHDPESRQSPASAHARRGLPTVMFGQLDDVRIRPLIHLSEDLRRRERQPRTQARRGGHAQRHPT